MEPTEELPTISIVIPTCNSERVLRECLRSIECQNYPKEKIELIIVDAGSTDKTLGIAEEYADRIAANPLRTGEAGKAIGVRNSSFELVAFIDSDNILPTSDWIERMVEPFKDQTIVGSDPIYYTWREEDSTITRYCALMGMNDPLCFFIGNYDRYCHITGRWTGLTVIEHDEDHFLTVELDEKQIPTLGANGFLVRKDRLVDALIGDYLFDIDVVWTLVSKGHNKFAKVKIGIIHDFASSVSMFSKKQERRIRDYLYYRRLNLRKYPWGELNRPRVLAFVLSTILIAPLLVQAGRGYSKKRDRAWFFHIPACWITLLIYSLRIISRLLDRRLDDVSREKESMRESPEIQ